MKSKSRVLKNGLRTTFVYVAAAITMAVLVGIIGYVLYKGVPELSW